MIGLGYLGLTHAAALASMGHKVVGIEQDSKRVSDLRFGKLPFYEPGLEDEVKRNVSSGSLTFQTGHDAHSRDSSAYFICVGTPQTSDSESYDTSSVFSAARELAQHMLKDSLVIGKSTVPIGTAQRLQKEMSLIAGFDVQIAWNPEFLREGTALYDSLNPDRIVIGATEKALFDRVLEIYAPIVASGSPVIKMDLPSAELVKLAANAFLATKISFINAMAEVAEVTGADVLAVAEAIGHDKRIGRDFLNSGLGFGGGCLPKDIRGFAAWAEERGVGKALDFLRSVDKINLRRVERVLHLAKGELGTLDDKTILVLGISFKPNSDDLRESPSLHAARGLADLGATVRVYDPVASASLADSQGRLEVATTIEAGFDGADLVILGTEWSEFTAIEPKLMGTIAARRVIIDGRNILDVHIWQEAGWRVIALGRNVHE